MSPPKLIALLVLLAFTLGACSKHKDPTLPQREKDAALQTALDELTRLSSYTETGLNYTEYSDRLLTAKGNIDVALQRTADQSAKAKIEHAVSCYVDARNEWKKKLEDKYYFGEGVQHYWSEGTTATRLAAEYAFADEAIRQQIDDRERKTKEMMRKLDEEARAAVEATEKKEQAEKDKIEKERQAKAAEAEQRRREAEQKRMAEEADRERIRRFAPEGTVYNVRLLTVSHQDGLSSIPPGTELTVTKKNPDGTLHVQHGELAADVPPDSVTNDRDLADAARTGDKKKQEALRQWNAQQNAAAALQELIKRYKSMSAEEALKFLDTLSEDQKSAVLLAP